MKRTLIANETQSVCLQGERFYYKTGLDDITVKAVGGSFSRDYKLREGMGFNFKEANGFIELEITSSVDQEIEFEVSNAEVFDNGLKVSANGVLPVNVVSGAFDINGLVQIVNAGGANRGKGVVAVPANTATQVRPADLNRLKAALHFPVSVFIGTDNTVSAANGFPVDANSKWLDENTAALWVFSTTACNIPYIEDLK